MSIELTPDEKSALELVTKDFTASERRTQPYRGRWEHFYKLYRSYQDFTSAYSGASEPDRDSVLGDGKKRWGAELFIPYCFSTVETILPRMLSNRPRMLVLPRNQASEKNVENMRSTIDSQQERIQYELKLHDTGKSGLIYGLGVQKAQWRQEKAKRRKLVELTIPQRLASGKLQKYGEREEEVELFDDPDAEDIDIFDWFWDPFGHDIPSCSYAIHRTWRSTRYVLDKIECGHWRPLETQDVEGMGPSSKHDEVLAERLKAAGLGSIDRRGGDQVHEVLEYHDRERVITVLDREVPVGIADNPAWHGELPFAIFRPTTTGMKELPGIGEPEPIEHLQREVNTLRSQRRDNAALKLMQVFAYADGLVEEGDIAFFPGAMIPTAGEPRDLLFPLNVGDIPNSGYQEEANLQADIERVTGISDPVSGAGDSSQTATGVQLVQAAANVRIQMKTRRLEAETAKEITRQFGALNQQRILENREIRLPMPPMPGRGPERRWAWRKLGPGELMGEFDYEPEGGSTAPENVPQMRADAQAFMTLFQGNPNVDQRAILEHALRLYGIKQPESMLAPDTRIPQIFPALLAELGVDQELIAQALYQAVEIEELQAQQSPNLQQSENGAEPAGVNAGG